jgi:ferredoxin-NADP reductase
MSTQTRRRGVLRVADLLATPHGIDRFTELVRPLWSGGDLRAEVTSVHHQTPDSVTLGLRPNGLWDGFAAGQYTQVTVEVDGVRHTRCYSLAGSAHGNPGRLELTVKAHDGGRVSSHLVRHARPGLVLGLAPAAGDFTLPERRPDRLLLVSAGSGVTPVMSILRTLCDEGHRGDVTFLHYAPTPDDALYRDEVGALAARHPNVQAVAAYTRAPGNGALDGRFTPAHLAAADPRWASAEAYVCGPPGLRDGVTGAYAAAGRAAQAHVEAFTPAVAPAAVLAGPGGGTVRFATSACAVPDDGRPLLDQAEAAGLTPRYGCRMGICHTCTRPLRAGAVRHTTTGDLTTEAGSGVQLCVNAPVGDVEIDL